MEPSFELLSFLARSENRLAALRALSTGPRRRMAVQDATGIPRATLSRILADCRNRDLVERTGSEYALTPFGHRLVEELEALLVTIDRSQALQTLASGLPLDDLDIDLFEVEDLSVTLPSRIDPMAPIRRAADLVGSAHMVQGFCYSLLHAPILAMTRDIVENDGRFEGVVSADILSHVTSDPDLYGPVRDLLRTDQAEVHVYQDGIETQFILTEDRIIFVVADGEGAIQGLVETTDPRLRPWAEARFAALRAGAEPLDPDAFSDLLTA